jgi:hypothetical protein
MKYDPTKIDEAALALLGAFAWTEHGLTHAWKGIDFEVSDRLFEKGLIYDPKCKAKSLVLTEEGVAAAQAAAEKLFGTGSSSS